MSHRCGELLEAGTHFRSPGGSFAFVVVGPCCRLYDREELPWPSCSLAWRGKQPSWRRVGSRFVGDLAAKSFPSYSVIGVDRNGFTWQQVITDYTYKLGKPMKAWWYARTPPPGKPWPSYPNPHAAGADGPTAEMPVAV